MAAETTTIRVTRETRDLLARQARNQGVSVAAMLADLARDAERAAIFRMERETSGGSADPRDAAAEERDWEAAVGDGVD